MAIACAALAAEPATTQPALFRLVTIDGVERTAARLVIAADGTLDLSGGEGPTPATLDALSEIAPPDSGAAPRAAGGCTFHLADGGTLSGKILAASADQRGVRVDLGLTVPVELPFAGLAAVRFATPLVEPAEREFAERRARRDATRDCALVVTPDGVAALPGALEELTADTWAFRAAGRTRRGTLDRLYALVFAGGNATRRPSARITLRGGGDFGGDLLEADVESLVVRATFGADLTLPWGAIARVELASGRVEFVSSLKPAAVESRGTFGHVWPWRADQSLAGGPLTIGPRRFARGLAVHSRCRLSYDLAERYDRFGATIGLEHGVPPSASAVFRVVADERTAFDSGPVRAADAPRDILVDIAGARRIVLEVDYGEGLDIGDRAIWGQARLIR